MKSNIIRIAAGESKTTADYDKDQELEGQNVILVNDYLMYSIPSAFGTGGVFNYTVNTGMK